MSNKQSIPEEIGTMNPTLLNSDPGDDRRSERSPSSNQIRVGSTTAISVITTSEVTKSSGKDVYKAIEFPSTTSREIRSETEVSPIDAVTLLNALCKTAELIGKGGLAYHDGRRLQETAAYFSRPEAQGLEANIPEAKGLIGDVRSKVTAALFGVEKNMTEVISGIRKELQKINAPIMIEVDDKTNSTEYRGRVSARVIIPLDILSERLAAQGQKLEFSGLHHRIALTDLASGETIEVRMPYLFEGVRLYRGEQDGVQYLSCETLSLLDPDQIPNLGILQRFIAPSAPISLPADEKRTLLTKSLGVEVKKLGDMKEL